MLVHWMLSFSVETEFLYKTWDSTCGARDGVCGIWDSVFRTWYSVCKSWFLCRNWVSVWRLSLGTFMTLHLNQLRNWRAQSSLYWVPFSLKILTMLSAKRELVFRTLHRKLLHLDNEMEPVLVRLNRGVLRIPRNLKLGGFSVSQLGG